MIPMIPLIIGASMGAGALNQHMQNRKDRMQSTMTGEQYNWMKEAGDSWKKDLSGKPDEAGLSRLYRERIEQPGWNDFRTTATGIQKGMGQNFFGNAKQDMLQSAYKTQGDNIEQQKAEMLYNEQQDARLRQAQARQGLQGLIDINSLAYSEKPNYMDQAGQVLGAAGAIQSMYNQRNKPIDEKKSWWG